MKEPWFVIARPWRLVPVHWKGWASIVALGGVAAGGAALDDALKQSASGPLYILGMLPACIAVLALAWVITAHIDRER